jgi:pimeloyl-ACP methyl ester carboxylesterase
VSTPRRLGVPPGVVKDRVRTDRGEFAALRADPAVTPYGSVVLVPGWTGSKEDFTETLRPLAGQGFTALAYDQRGQYETATVDGGYALADFAADVAAIAAGLPQPVHVVGHSFGGLVVQRAVIAAPEVYASATLLCSGPGPLPEWHHALLRQMADAIGAHGLAATYAAKVAYESTLPGYVPPPPEIATFLERRFTSNAAESLRQITLHLIDASNDASDDASDAIDQLAASGVPLLVAYGEGDDGWPPEIQDVMAKRLSAKRAVIPGGGHSPQVNAPSATVAVLTRFWTASQSGSA